jgi:hypothetical protein
MVSHSVNQSSINVQDARRLQPCQESCFLLNPAGALVGLESNLRNIRVEDSALKIPLVLNKVYKQDR